MAYDKVIIFGPTGSVGSQTALEASKRGAHVYLAMRYPEKPIPLLDGVEGTFTRIKADLSEPTSCANAVKESGAKAAYIYLVHTQDGMKSTLSAMKDAGLEYVVFLSSFSILAEQDIRKMNPRDSVSFAHAMTEVSLEDIGLKNGFVALRAGNFASNNEKMQLDRTTTPWTAHLLFPESVGDGIAPVDMGRVGGSVLVNPPEGTGAGKRIYLLGPEMIRYDEQWNIIKRVSGKDINVIVHEDDPNGFKDFLISRGLPPPMAADIVDQQIEGRSDTLKWFQHYDKEKDNVKKYSGYEPTSYEEYVASEKW